VESGKVVDEGFGAVRSINGRNEQRRDATTAGRAFEDDMAAGYIHPGESLEYQVV
jgi:hypothetical protein